MTAWLAASLGLALIAGAATTVLIASWPHRVTAEEWILRRRQARTAPAPRSRPGRPFSVRLPGRWTEQSAYREAAQEVERDLRLARLGRSAALPSSPDQLLERLAKAGLTGAVLGLLLAVFAWRVGITQSPWALIVLLILLGGLGRGFARSGLGEGLRLLQVGLPIYLLCLWAEARGRRCRLATPAGATPPPPPAPKARPPVRRQYVLPPMAWRREWEATLLTRQDQVSGPAVPVAPQPLEPQLASSSPLTIRSLGTLQLLWAGEDLTSRLLRAPTLSFIWLFLLTHAAARPGAKVHRQLLAEEAFPGIDPEQQRGRVRGRLSDLQHDLPAVLAERVKVDGDLLRLDLETADFDVARLRSTADDLAGGTGLLTEAGIKTIQAAIADYGGEYLPVWDEVERQATSGRGSAGDLVRAVRGLAEDLHIQLLIRLARHYQARHDSPQAIPLLEEALRRRPEREDVAQLLIADYRETGQAMRARQLETTYQSEFVQAQRKPEIE